MREDLLCLPFIQPHTCACRPSPGRGLRDNRAGEQAHEGTKTGEHGLLHCPHYRLAEACFSVHKDAARHGRARNTLRAPGPHWPHTLILNGHQSNRGERLTWKALKMHKAI